jgi:hypothetical protein
VPGPEGKGKAEDGKNRVKTPNETKENTGNPASPIGAEYDILDPYDKVRQDGTVHKGVDLVYKDADGNREVHSIPGGSV